MLRGFSRLPGPKTRAASGRREQACPPLAAAMHSSWPLSVKLGGRSDDSCAGQGPFQGWTQGHCLVLEPSEVFLGGAASGGPSAIFHEEDDAKAEPCRRVWPSSPEKSHRGPWALCPLGHEVSVMALSPFCHQAIGLGADLPALPHRGGGQAQCCVPPPRLN